jgi:RNA polymerase sigma-70 factor (ECF subfamily)
MLPTDSPPTRHTLLCLLADPGNEAAWQTFVHDYQPTIERWCGFHLRPQDAEDVSQRILCKLVRRMADGTFDRTRGRFRTWLRAVVENEVRDFRRSLRRRPDAGTGGCGEQCPDPSSLDDLTDELDQRLQDDLLLADQIITAVREQVTERSWAAFWHTRCLGQPSSEVARQLGMSVAAVAQARFRVGKTLRQHWEQRRSGSRI